MLLPTPFLRTVTVTEASAACSPASLSPSPAVAAACGLATTAAQAGRRSPRPAVRGPPRTRLSTTPTIAKGEAVELASLLAFLFPGTVIGFAVEERNMSINIEVSDQNRLAGLRASLSEEFAVQTARLKELTEISADTGDPGEAHNRAALLTATRRNLEQITGALRRIAEGGYGRCEKCDNPIPAERLEVLPHARLCVACQREYNG